MIEDFENNLKTQFRDLMKSGKDTVLAWLKETDELYTQIDNTTIYDELAKGILTQIEIDKKFDFNQFKELNRFRTEQQRLFESRDTDNDYILL